ncbi:hypothetical protein [Psychrobacter sp. WY6]|uniref:hypothetical protein n=1 Tax=Psychrobacter sp. WY6 TaxID=2708350 RepID=UPI00202310AA|nr:hypothetical protein [Psychrobacter sp. WY6]
MLFIETDSPPPFYQEQLTPAKRTQLDKWFIGHRSPVLSKTLWSSSMHKVIFRQNGMGSIFVTFPWLLYRKRYMDAMSIAWLAGRLFSSVALVLVAFEFLAMSFILMLTRWRHA